MEAAPPNVTELLRLWTEGDRQALDAMMPVVMSELKCIAAALIRNERTDHTLQATALVNEAYLRLVGANHVSWEDRAHFFALAARLMRRILVDHARSRMGPRRGGRYPHVQLADDQPLQASSPEHLLELDQAMTRLEQIDPRKSKVVELKAFAGLEGAEIAAILGVTRETVQRDWRFACTWLARELSSKTIPESQGQTH